MTFLAILLFYANVDVVNVVQVNSLSFTLDIDWFQVLNAFPDNHAWGTKFYAFIMHVCALNLDILLLHQSVLALIVSTNYECTY